MRRITIKDVAREVGLSPSAVSRVFTEGAPASEETRRKVTEAAERLGYRPSLLARGLAASRTNLVTLVSGGLSDPFDAAFVEAMAAALAARGVRLMLVHAGEGNGGEAALLDALDYQSDAVIVAAGTLSLAHSSLCVKAGLPIILVGRVEDAPGVDGVVADNAAGARQAAELLRRTGSKRLAYLGRGGASFSDRERHDGFAAAAGGPVEVAHAGAREIGEAMKAAMALLTRPDPPDGIFCHNDLFAIGVIEAARALGLTVPGDVSVVGFNDIALASSRSFRLTTVDLSVPALVEGVLTLLDRRLAQPDAPGAAVRIPVQLVVRATTRELAPA